MTKMKKFKLLIMLCSLVTIFVIFESCDETEEQLDPCANITCEIGEICNYGICECPDGFIGINCETIDPCFGITCENGGTCINGICDCPDGYIGTNCDSIDLTLGQVQELLDGGITPLELVNSGLDINSLYGKLYEGGYIFYYNISNNSGLVVATEDQSDGATWGCFGDVITGADEGNIGSGLQNTTEILAGCNESLIAARICTNLTLNGKDDWFLPSINELFQIYSKLYSNGQIQGSTAGGTYWSSTEDGNLSATCYNFYFNNYESNIKSTSLYVRAVRTF